MSGNIQIAHKLLSFFLILNSAIILVPDKFKGIPVIGLLVIAIFYFIVFKSENKFNFKLFLVSTSFFFVLLVSILYSENVSYALKKLETSLSLLAYPLIFVLLYNCLEKIEDNFIEIIKWVFIISLMFFLLFTFTYYFTTEPYFTFESTIVHYRTLIDIRIIGYEMHSIYLSIHIGVAIILLIDIISKNKGLRKFYAIFLLILFFVFLAILYKRGPIIALGIIGLIFIIQTKIKTALYILALSFVFVLTLIVVPKFNSINRFKEVIDIDGFKTNPNSSTALRLSIYNCALEQAAESPIIGYGWGDVKGVLNECYEEKNPNLLLHNYNSHNQFLAILLSTGIFGLLVFLYYFYYLLKFSNKKGNRVLFFLLLYFGFNMLSENILEREDGVIFFSFFVNLFLFNTENSINKIQEKQ